MTEQETGGPEPGWFRDPNADKSPSFYRWWDGTQWTSRVTYRRADDDVVAQWWADNGERLMLAKKQAKRAEWRAMSSRERWKSRVEPIAAATDSLWLNALKPAWRSASFYGRQLIVAALRVGLVMLVSLFVGPLIAIVLMVPLFMDWYANIFWSAIDWLKADVGYTEWMLMCAVIALAHRQIVADEQHPQRDNY